ncbi:MAG: hypothetical protein IJX67_06030 [Oscillospiraceae bacterium]|nr:hypothetical protein [Oscillospiraceae bacterium]
MSDIASLEAELRRQQSINRELQYELNLIASGVNNAYNRLENFNKKICNVMDTSKSMLDDSTNKMLSALETQAEIERLYVRFKAMELANKRIRDCNNKKYYDFANYSRVRKLVQGLMDNLDMNMASDRVIYKSIEREHLKTPDYWLTCVLLSIMGWKNDDKALADRAMELALKLDMKSSSIFYMLFNIRMDREDAALKWFMQYQQCELKGADQRTFLLLFALISKSINSSEELNEQSRDEINRFIHKVIDATITSQGYSREEMVENVLEHLRVFVPSEHIDYPLLRKHCGEYSRLNGIMMQAKANIAILEYFREVIHVQPEQRNTFIKNFIDEVIAASNDQEKAVYEEIAYNETIIRCEGDVDMAKEIFGKQKIHDEKELNLIYEMIEWVYGADKDDINGQSKMNMFVLTKDLQREAVDRRTEEYRACDRKHLKIGFGDYKTTMNFDDQAGETRKVETFYQEKRNAELAGIKNWPAFVGFGVGAAAAVASFFLSYALLVVTALGVGFGVIKLLTNKSQRKQLELQYQQNCRLATQMISDLYQEHKAFEEEYASYDAYYEEIQRELDCI